MGVISSSQNPLIKEIKALKSKKHRDEKMLYFVEGIRFVEEAIKSGAEISKIIISESLSEVKGGAEILSEISKMNIEVNVLTEKLFNEISDTESPQGIMAVMRQREFILECQSAINNFYLILESIQDPGNLGTIIRTADAAGVTGVIMSKGCVDLYNPKVLRSTMGSIFHIPVFFSGDLTETIKYLKSQGVKVVASHLNGSMNYFEMDSYDNIAVIIGNEANGISEKTALESDLLVRIPMPGKAESLNASVAAALLMYEFVRKNEITGN